MLSHQSAIKITSALVFGFCIMPFTRDANAQSVSSELFRTASCEAPGYGEATDIFDSHGCLSEQKTLTGNWWGARTSLEDNGITFDASVTQFFQGVTSGGRRSRFRYGGHGDYDMDFDFGRLIDAEGLSLDLGAEHRFGQSANPDTGAGVPVALLANLPEPDITDLALTKVLFEYAFSEQFRVLFGKLDTLEYDTNRFADGKGRDRFFSTAFNYNPIATRTIPFSTLGAGFVVGAEEEPRFVFAVLNTEDTATTTGFDELFADGAAMFAEFRLPTQFFGRSGHQMFGGSWSGRTFDSLSEDQRLDFPDIPIVPKEGSWALYWNSDQHIREDPCDPERGWGVFGRAGISDGNPNPVAWFLSCGLGGNSPIASRRDDTFGIGWFYTGTSDKLGPVASGFLKDGQGVELYYRIAVTDWFNITPDLQIVEPNQIGVDTAVVAGLRARIAF